MDKIMTIEGIRFNKSAPICEICGFSYELLSTDCTDFRR